jgi:hypothetical protein
VRKRVISGEWSRTIGRTAIGTWASGSACCCWFCSLSRRTTGRGGRRAAGVIPRPSAAGWSCGWGVAHFVVAWGDRLNRQGTRSPTMGWTAGAARRAGWAAGSGRLWVQGGDPAKRGIWVFCWSLGSWDPSREILNRVFVADHGCARRRIVGVGRDAPGLGLGGRVGVSGGLVVRLGAGRARRSGFMGSILQNAEPGFLLVSGLMGSILENLESGFWPAAAGRGCAGSEPWCGCGR